MCQKRHWFLTQATWRNVVWATEMPGRRLHPHSSCSTLSSHVLPSKNYCSRVSNGLALTMLDGTDGNCSFWSHFQHKNEKNWWLMPRKSLGLRRHHRKFWTPILYSLRSVARQGSERQPVTIGTASISKRFGNIPMCLVRTNKFVKRYNHQFDSFGVVKYV